MTDEELRINVISLLEAHAATAEHQYKKLTSFKDLKEMYEKNDDPFRVFLTFARGCNDLISRINGGA